MPTVEIVEMPEPLGLFSGQLFQRACEYFEGFGILSKDDEEGLRHPSYFLCIHAVELFLKAYLASTGTLSKIEIKNYGHNLPKLFARCESLSVPKIANLDHLVPALYEMNSDHDFRYPSNYNLHVPSPKLCSEVITELNTTLRPIIDRAHLKAQLRHSSETRHLRGKKIRWSD